MLQQFTLRELNDLYYALGTTYASILENWQRAKKVGDDVTAGHYDQVLKQTDDLQNKIADMIFALSNFQDSLESNTYVGTLEDADIEHDNNKLSREQGF